MLQIQNLSYTYPGGSSPVISMLNLDMKVVGFIYTWLNKFHDKKDSLRDIQF